MAVEVGQVWFDTDSHHRLFVDAVHERCVEAHDEVGHKIRVERDYFAECHELIGHRRDQPADADEEWWSSLR